MEKQDFSNYIYKEKKRNNFLGIEERIKTIHYLSQYSRSAFFIWKSWCSKILVHSQNYEIGDEKYYLLKCENKNIKRCRTESKIKIQTINPQHKYFDLENSVTYFISMNDELMHGETAKFLESIITIYENEEYI